MSRASFTWLTGASVILPFAAALLIAALGGAPRPRKVTSCVYAATAAVLNLVLLNGFLTLAGSGTAGWGSLRFTKFSFPAFLVLQGLAAAAVVYAAFRRSHAARQGLIVASIPAACGFGALALTVSTLAPFTLCWLAFSAAAMFALVVQGRAGIEARLRAFAPWLAADALLVLGAVLCSAWLSESAVLIEAPLTSGSETQTIIVAALFLASALLRLGIFPAHAWLGEVSSRADAGWSGFFPGANFLLSGMRLAVTITLIGRLVASDWSLGLSIAALLSVVAGPLIALRGKSISAAAAGLYCMQAGFLFLALSLFSRAGMEAGLFIALTAPVFITAFMMSAASAGDARGTGSLDGDPLPVRSAPALFAAALISGLAIAGLPPTDGFVGKASVALACADKAARSPFFALAMAFALVGLAAGLIALARFLGGVFAGAPRGVRRDRPGLVEGLVPLAVSAAALFVGAFPRMLQGNFIADGSRILFPTGFSGPGVVFQGTGEAVGASLSVYLSWAEPVAAFALVLAAVVLVSYFTNRAAHPSEGIAERFAPFTGGTRGRYTWSWEPVEFSFGRLRSRRRPARAGETVPDSGGES